MGLSALKSTFKDAGLSEEGVNHTMDQVKEVSYNIEYSSLDFD